MLSEESTVPGFRGFFAEWRLERKDAESAETISHRDHREQSPCPAVGSPAFGRHMDREPPGITSATRFHALVSSGRLSIHVARSAAHRLADFTCRKMFGRLSLSSVDLCAK